MEGFGCGYKYMTVVHSQNHRFQAKLSEINSTTGSVSSCWSELVSLSI